MTAPRINEARPGTGGEPSPYHGIAYHEGLVPALASLLRDVTGGGTPFGPGGHAVVPVRFAPRTGAIVVARYRTVDGEELVALRQPEPEVSGVAHVAWLLGLAWLRLGLSEALLETCLRHLGQRMSGGTSLLTQQLVRGDVADSAIEQLEVHAVLADTSVDDWGSGALGAIHDQITRVDRGLLRLLGAAGYLGDGPGQMTYLSELVACAAVAPELDS